MLCVYRPDVSNTRAASARFSRKLHWQGFHPTLFGSRFRSGRTYPPISFPALPGMSDLGVDSHGIIICHRKEVYKRIDCLCSSSGSPHPVSHLQPHFEATKTHRCPPMPASTELWLPLSKMTRRSWASWSTVKTLRLDSTSSEPVRGNNVHTTVDR